MHNIQTYDLFILEEEPAGVLSDTPEENAVAVTGIDMVSLYSLWEYKYDWNYSVLIDFCINEKREPQNCNSTS